MVEHAITELFRKKLEDIHAGLMQRYRETQQYSTAIAGTEREAVKKQLLSLILPPGYRIGSGAIIDVGGRETGQVDAVIEQPFSLSFPIATDTNRLYLADTVGAAFEIKSNLNSQAKEALKKIEQIRSLIRRKVGEDEVIQYGLLQVPSFIVAYTGPKSLSALEERFIKPRDRYYPNGILVIESELFSGWSASGNYFYGSGAGECVLAFLSCLLESLRFAASNSGDLFSYSKLLNRS